MSKRITLMSHQKQGVEFLKDMDGVGALLWDPGTGKTLATLAYIDYLAEQYGEVRVLVIAPLTACDTWVLQPEMYMKSTVKARLMQGRTADILKRITAANEWTRVTPAKIQSNLPGTKRAQKNGQRVTILSMSAGAISNFCGDRVRKVQMIQAVRRYRPHVIVVDESHIIKAPYATISEAMYQMAPLAPHRIILTGTVMPLGPLDVYGQWRFLAPWTFSKSYGKKFTKKPWKMTRENWQESKPWAFGAFSARYDPGGWENYTNLEDLNARIAERSMVVRKRDVLDLPPVQDIEVPITLTNAEQGAYKSMREELLAELESGELLEAPNALAKIMKLRQITSGYLKNTETGERHVLGKTKMNRALDLVNTTLLGEKRIVIFAHFKPECAAVAEALKAKGRTVEVITGDTKTKDRLDIRQRFRDLKNNPEQIVLVAQARTMSISVNELVTAQHAIYMSYSERRADWVQSRDRLDRNGQKGNSVTFWNVIVPGTVDEIMLRNHKRRGDLEKELLDHIRGLI